MIQGLNVTVSGTEIRRICLDRASERRAKADMQRSNAKLLESMPQNAGLTSQRDPKEDMLQSAGRYEDEASELEFIAQHVEILESYRLESNDLRKLGIVKSGW